MTIPAIAELAKLKQFVGWRFEERDGKPTKVPINPHTGRRASATDRETWGNYDHACRAVKRYQLDGIGFVLSEDDDFVALDLDHCRDKATGALLPWAQALVDLCGSYVEITPSGEGLRIIGRGVLPPGRRKVGHAEIYDGGRFVTLTGNHLEGTPDTIADFSGRMAVIHAAVLAFGETTKPAKPPADKNYQIDAAPAARERFPSALSDDQVLDKLFAETKNGSKYRALHAGNWQQHFDSQSGADLSFCSGVAFYSGPDNPAQVDRLLRASGLMRKKWDQKRGALTYGERTITRALQSTTAFYNPQHGRPAKRNGRVEDSGSARPIHQPRETFPLTDPLADIIAAELDGPPCGERVAQLERDLEEAQTKLRKQELYIGTLLTERDQARADVVAREERLADYRRREIAITKLCASPAVSPTLKPTAIALALAAERDPRLANVTSEPTHVYRAQVAELAGILTLGTVSRQLKELSESGFLALARVPRWIEQHAEDGSITHKKILDLKIQLHPDNAVPMSRRLELLARSPSRGKLAPRRSSCCGAELVRKWHCSVCDRVEADEAPEVDDRLPVAPQKRVDTHAPPECRNAAPYPGKGVDDRLPVSPATLAPEVDDQLPVPERAAAVAELGYEAPTAAAAAQELAERLDLLDQAGAQRWPRLDLGGGHVLAGRDDWERYAWEANTTAIAYASEQLGSATAGYGAAAGGG